MQSVSKASDKLVEPTDPFRRRIESTVGILKLPMKC